MKVLLSSKQIYSNLRRTASYGLISLLTTREINKLAGKHFGVYKDGKLMSFRCPYSDEIIDNKKDLVLEHIIPVSSSGGTILFNCIPSHSKINGIGEKGAKHLLAWWTQSEYWNPMRLEKLLDYMFEGYELVFSKYKINEVENSYKNIEFETNDEKNNYDIESDLTITSEEIKKELENQKKETGLITYLQFINDCIDELRKNNIDVQKYETKLSELSNKGIFKDIDRCTIFQNTLKEIIKNKISEKSGRKYLSILLNFDVKRLMDSMFEYNTKEDIYNEINKRIENIENILIRFNISIDSYFEDIANLSNVDILNKKTEEITESDIFLLIQKINLCFNDKFDNLMQFMEEKNNRPFLKNIDNEREKELYDLLYKIKSLNCNLTKKQLEQLATSEKIFVRTIYEEILIKSLKQGKKISYIDEKIIKQYYDEKGNLDIDKIDMRLKEISSLNMIESHSNKEKIEIEFNKLLEFLILEDRQPKKRANNEEEKQLYYFLNNIKSFHYKLTKSQLEQLAISEKQIIKRTYEEILLKSLKQNIEIEYVDIKILESYYNNQNILDTDKIDERLKEISGEIKSRARINILEQERRFEQLISFMNENLKPPIREKKELEEENIIYNFLVQIKQLNILLSYEQLEKLATSEQEFIRRIYEEILLKSLKYNIKISYIDEKIIKQYYDENGKLNIDKIDNRIQYIYMENRLYSSLTFEERESEFNKLIQFMNKNNRTPLERKKEEQELYKKLRMIKSFDYRLLPFELEKLATSEQEFIRRIYEEILLKSLKQEKEILYVDGKIIQKYYNEKGLLDVDKVELRLKEIASENRKKRIIDMEEKKIKDTRNIKRKKTNQEMSLISSKTKKNYKLIREANFDSLLIFMYKEQRIPSTNSKNEEEKQIGRFLNGMKQINFNLSYEQLKKIATSEQEFIRRIYEEILLKHLKNGIDIEFMDKKIIEQYYDEKGILDIDKIDRRLKEILSKNRSEGSTNIIRQNKEFDNLIEFLEEQKRPPSIHSSDKDEKKLKSVLDNIKQLNWNLSYEQLEQLATSEQKFIRRIYEEILLKSLKQGKEIAFRDEKIIKQYYDEKGNLNIEQIDIALKNIVKLNLGDGKNLKNLDDKQMKFDELYQFMIENNKSPSNISNDKNEKKVASFLAYIKQLTVILTYNQLKMLAESEQDFIKRIYEEVLLKSLKQGIDISFKEENIIRKYYDEKEMLNIDKINCRLNELASQNRKDSALNKSNREAKYDRLFEFMDIQNRPPKKDSTIYEEKQLSNFLSQIKQLTVILSYEQLEKLATSKKEFIRRLYEEIVLKSLKQGIDIALKDDKIIQEYCIENEILDIDKIDKRLKEISNQNKKNGMKKDYNLNYNTSANTKEFIKKGGR